MTMHEKTKCGIGAIIITTILCVAYFPARNNFLMGDDFEWLNSAYAGWYHPQEFFQLINNFFRPVVKMSYLLDYLCFGHHVFFYNLTTFGIHLANVLLLYFFLLKTSQRRRFAWVVALAFGVSSLYSEVTLWAAGRPDSLLLLCMLGILMIFADSVRPTFFHYLASLCLTLGAIGSKETWILFPVLLTSFLLIIRRLPKKISIKYTLIQWASLIVYVAIFIILPAITRHAVPSQAYAQASAEEGARKFCLLLVKYAGLSSLYSGALWQAILVLLGLSGVAFWIVKCRNRFALWGMIWMLLTIFISLPISYAPSRYNYLPLVGFWIMVIAIVEPISVRFCRAFTIKPMLQSVILGAFLLTYSSFHIAMLQNEIQDYARFGELYRAIFNAYRPVMSAISFDLPILVMNKGTYTPIRKLAASIQGYPKLFFVRGGALWELVTFDTLTNFAGNPFSYLLVPFPQQDVREALEQPCLMVEFTDQGFRALHDSATAREELQTLYDIHGRLPDNVAFYHYIPTRNMPEYQR